jgi:retinol dehydrogenase 12
MGKEVARILFSKNAKVYIATRSEERATKAIEDIKKQTPNSKGSLIFVKLDISDLSTIKASVNSFLAQESKLDGLFNNAGVMYVDTKGPQTTPQGYEMNLGINVLGTFLFTKLLTPILISTAQSEPAGSVRIIWVSSLGTEMQGEKSKGISVDDLEVYSTRPPMERYGLSKAGNWLHGVEAAERLRSDGVVSVPINPGNCNTELARQHPKIIQRILQLIVYPAVNGAYTQLYAALTGDIDLENSGIWGKCRFSVTITRLTFSVAPFGRLLPIRADLLDATRSKQDGGNGHAAAFWEWSEEQVKPYV